MGYASTIALVPLHHRSPLTLLQFRRAGSGSSTSRHAARRPLRPRPGPWADTRAPPCSTGWFIGSCSSARPDDEAVCLDCSSTSWRLGEGLLLAPAPVAATAWRIENYQEVLNGIPFIAFVLNSLKVSALITLASS